MDKIYVQSRHAFLDALGALGANRKAAVLVGAQAVYLHAGETTVAVAPYTTDGDILLDRIALLAELRIEDAMKPMAHAPHGRSVASKEPW